MHSPKVCNPLHVRLFHIDLNSDLKVGSHVTSGQWIGIIGPQDGTEEYRDAHPFTCGGKPNHPLIKADEAFQHISGRSWTEDFVFLKPIPYPKPFDPVVPIGPPVR